MSLGSHTVESAHQQSESMHNETKKEKGKKRDIRLKKIDQLPTTLKMKKTRRY